MRKSLLCILCIILCLSARTQADKGDLPKQQHQQEVAEYEARISEMKNFSTLRSERRDLLRKILQAKASQMSDEAKVAGLRIAIEETQSRLGPVEENEERMQRYESDLKRAQTRLSSLQQDGKPEGQSEEEYNNDIISARESIDFLRGMVGQEKRNQVEQARLASKLTELKEKLSIANEVLQQHQNSSEKLQDGLEIVEDKINTLLIPTTAENEFKLWVTIAFTSLVGLVIAGFFLVSAGDKDVRRAIFSSQSGIQFITLFSLVIAIILFGITEILGAKELAALLGGISGYILGRVSESRMRGCGGGLPQRMGLSQRGSLSQRRDPSRRRNPSQRRDVYKDKSDDS